MAKRRGRKEYLSNLVFSAIINTALALPYPARVRMMGWVMSRVVAPIAGWRARIRANLAHVMPDLPAREVERLVRKVPNNVGRSLIEGYSGDDFISRTADLPLQGPGVAALEAARDAGRPTLLVTAHFGNYLASRAALVAKGCSVGALYMPMTNGYFNDRYATELARGGPVFERSRRGLLEMVKFLKGGGMVGVIADHFMAHGTPIDFLGQPAYTALSSAELALKHDAAVIPVYSRRKADGLSFEIIVDAPIPHGDPLEMTRAMNASLEPFIRDNPEQWFWIHRRWKSPPAPATEG